MIDEEDIVAYMLHVNEIVNSIKGLGEEMKDSLIVKKIIKSLLLKFDSKVFVIEEEKDLNNISLDELTI